jgi:hypothetical protein
MARSPAAMLVALTACAALGQPTVFCEAQRLVSPPEVPPFAFGSEVASNGEYWFVADHNARTWCSGSAFECATGAVFAYQEFDGRLELVQTLIPPDVELYDIFGASMDVDGDRLIVGSRGGGWPGVGFDQGIAYIYELEGGQWVETGRLQPPAEVTEHFGTSVYLSGDVALASSRMPERNVYWYEQTNDGWVLRGTVPPPEPLIRGDCFGCTGTALGEWLFLGAYLESSPSTRNGVVYAYRRRADNTFEFVQKIAPADTGYFGVGMGFDGHTLAIGAVAADRDVVDQGVVQTYRFDGERWVFEQELTHDEPQVADQLGFAVEVQGDLLLASASGDSTPPSVAGRVYRFERDASGRWQETGTLEIAPPVIARRYGSALALHGNGVLIGAPEEVDASFDYIGAAYFFDLACNPCRPDLDLDGALTIFDFLTFLNLFQDGDTQADFDGDGELTIFDFLAFQTAFDAGCP